MYVKIVCLEIIERESGLREDLKILMNVDIGIYIVSKSRDSILGININDVLRNKKMSKKIDKIEKPFWKELNGMDGVIIDISGTTPVIIRKEDLSDYLRNE